MSTGLSIGGFLWQDRWVYPDTKDSSPCDEIYNRKDFPQDKRKNNKEPAKFELDAVPYHLNELRDTPQSLYDVTFQPKNKEFDRTATPKARTRTPTLNYPTKRFDNTRGKRPAPSWLTNHHMDPYFFSEMNTTRLLKEKPEEYSFRLWGRINPSYQQTEFVSESRRHLRDHFKEGTAVPPKDRQYFNKIKDKHYTEALVKHNKTMRKSNER